MRHLLISNDFPPKVGGIQSYLYEIYRRSEPDSVVVITTRDEAASVFDRRFGVPVIRLGTRLLPTASTRRSLVRIIEELDPPGLVIDPIWPLGMIASKLGRPYAVIAHGAELTIPGRLPGLRGMVRQTLAGARGVIAAGSYPAREVQRFGADLEVVTVSPGVDLARFRPPSMNERGALRQRLMLNPEQSLVLFVSRLVPRKGADRLIEAMTMVHDAELHIVGDGRDRPRLERMARSHRVPAVFHGAVDDDELVEWYQAADVAALPARARWFGLEQEGFGIVVLEAQACGVPVVGSSSGGIPDALSLSGSERIDRSGSPRALARAISCILKDRPGRSETVRSEMVARFDYDLLARRYHDAIAGWFQPSDR
ncbi:MAG: glycosyltransferase family 4 protein [Ferrimicrobium sp.]